MQNKEEKASGVGHNYPHIKERRRSIPMQSGFPIDKQIKLLFFPQWRGDMENLWTQAHDILTEGGDAPPSQRQRPLRNCGADRGNLGRHD